MFPLSLLKLHSVMLLKLVLLCSEFSVRLRMRRCFMVVNSSTYTETTSPDVSRCSDTLTLRSETAGRTATYKVQMSLKEKSIHSFQFFLMNMGLVVYFESIPYRYCCCKYPPNVY